MSTRPPDRSPEQLATEELKGAFLTIWRWAFDHGRRYLTASLLKTSVIGVIGVAIAAYSLPAVAAVACGVAVAGGIVYGIYGRRIYHDERVSRRWTWISAKRLQQDKLRLEQRLDTAVFDVLRRAPGSKAGAGRSSAELRQAIAFVHHQARQQQVPGPGQHERRPAPKAPDLNMLQARMEGRKADIDALEAEIQSLAVPENVDTAMAAEEARAHAISARDSALAADQAARERSRRGQTATPRAAGVSLDVTIAPTGVQDVRSVRVVAYARADR